MDLSTTPLIIAIAIAFGAGMVSILSPCILPLLPGYLAFLAGANTADRRTTMQPRAPRGADSTAAVAQRPQSQTATVTRAAAFCAGFSAVFIVAGLGLGVLGSAGGQVPTLVTFGGGAIIAIFGLLLVWNRPMPGTGSAGTLMSRLPRPQSHLGAVGAGVVVSVAWTPCIGVTLAAILTMATVAGNAVTSTVLLAAYATGLSVPFMALALGLGRLDEQSSWMRRNARSLNVATGAVLVGFGLVVASGEMGQLSAWLGGLLPVVL
uniref:Cytochrome c biogenesis protein transmembrane region protein n=1 Tax=uncultured bacterium W5-102b TaxID=1130996 RepID=H9BWJ4_9BACT|nr:cytochrome c biogenesis protein transmembrane region protein [uncultured bacterium W5-102b]